MNIFKSTEYKTALKELKKINELEESMVALSDKELQGKTEYFKQELEKGKTLEDIRVEVYAVIREAAKRVLKKRLYDVQIIGGLILDYGSVAEMKTGEGKTITSLPPVYLNALEGKGVIISTVNEYLTERDALEMGEVHQWMGLTVGINKSILSANQKREEYAKDITYSVHSEIGFDYLRDNMVASMEDKVQRGFNYGLIDEVDSILIDEARTPLIISNGEEKNSQLYLMVDFFVKSLNKKDYEIDWESKGIQLSNEGIDKANKFFKQKNIFSLSNSELVHRLQNSLRANYTMNRDADYLIREGEIMIIDAFTGRVMEGRSFSEGLHQAIEAKEGVEIKPENITAATITYQNLFRMFKKLSGMSGTAKTEEDEFIEIYNMRVHVIETNKPMIRIDHDDLVFVTAQAKYKAVVDKVKELYKKKQPILLGTEEVSESEHLSSLLKKENIPHTVLNAKQNKSEAEIVARAGEKGVITIATNMAGRGTDIKPSKETLKAGGLFVIGTNKAEARRIDNQLKGRSGRQGDIGESQFFLSLDDKLISRFSNQEKLKKIFNSFGEAPITNKAINKALKRAQIKIEGFNFDARKNVLQFDDVIRQQRDLIYAQRDLIIGQEDLWEIIERMMKSVVKEAIIEFENFKRPDGSYDMEKMVTSLNNVWFSNSKKKLVLKEIGGLSVEEIVDKVSNLLIATYLQVREETTDQLNAEALHNFEKNIIQNIFDDNWKLHIDHMQKLRSSSSLASYAQQNPYQQYVTKGAELFKQLLNRISHNTVKILMNSNFVPRDKIEEQI